MPTNLSQIAQAFEVGGARPKNLSSPLLRPLDRAGTKRPIWSVPLIESCLRRRLLGPQNFPTPDALREMLASAEVESFFAAQDTIEPDLLETAWTLHHVGTVRAALRLYDPGQQVQANIVAAHIFDLALRDDTIDAGYRLMLTFRHK